MIKNSTVMNYDTKNKLNNCLIFVHKIIIFRKKNFATMATAIIHLRIYCKSMYDHIKL